MPSLIKALNITKKRATKLNKIAAGCLLSADTRAEILTELVKDKSLTPIEIAICAYCIGRVDYKT